MDKNRKKLYSFLYEAKKKWFNYCFSWLGNIWVKNWNNIMSYRTNLDVLKQTWIEEKTLISIINEETNIYKNIEIKSNYLRIWLTQKWLEEYKKYLKHWYEKINWKWFIWKIISLLK
jgi:hypothetical protein